jgi:hypothetical protein
MMNNWLITLSTLDFYHFRKRPTDKSNGKDSIYKVSSQIYFTKRSSTREW